MSSLFFSSLCLSLLSCSDSTDPTASYEVVTYKSAPFALNGTPIGAATAINTGTAITVRAEVEYGFDVAFDIDGSGRPVFLTQRAVGAPQGATGHQVALRPIEGNFDEVLLAPATGWVNDSVYTARIGEVVGVRASITACQYDLRTYTYSKMMVDSINTAQRRLYVTVTTDPNCGFRSFEPGRPSR